MYDSWKVLPFSEREIERKNKRKKGKKKRERERPCTNEEKGRKSSYEPGSAVGGMPLSASQEKTICLQVVQSE